MSARAGGWTPEEEAWLREVYPDHHNAEIAEMHSEAFPDLPERTAKAVNSRAKVLRLRKADGFQRNPPTFWTPGKVEWFRSFVPGHHEAEISAEHERLYGTPLTDSQIGNAKVRFGVKSGTDGGRFRRGMEPANKGRTWDEMGISPEAQARSRATCFKKGNMPHNGHQPIGTERVNAGDGYVYVKVAERKTDPRSAHDNWRPKHHIAYERAHGPIPDGCNVVFADHDKRNFDPGNLVAVPRDLWGVMSRKGMQYADRESLETCMAIARLDRMRSEAERAPRECGLCGREFVPRYPLQRTCDACLEAGRRAPRSKMRPAGGDATCEVCGSPYVRLRGAQRRCPGCIAEMPHASVEQQKKRRGRSEA